MGLNISAYIVDDFDYIVNKLKIDYALSKNKIINYMEEK